MAETVLGKWRCGSTSNLNQRQKGTATAIRGGPLSIANISFEEELSIDRVWNRLQRSDLAAVVPMASALAAGRPSLSATCLLGR